MSEIPEGLAAFLAGDCPECGTPGPVRHLSAVGGCGTCAAGDPRPVLTPVRRRHDAVPCTWGEPGFSPLRNLLTRPFVRELLKRRAEDRDRRRWVEDMKWRLCLVGPGEVLHRARVRRGLFRCEPAWEWSCRVPQCARGTGYRTQGEAFGAAYAHASSWMAPRLAAGGGVTVRMPGAGQMPAHQPGGCAVVTGQE